MIYSSEIVEFLGLPLLGESVGGGPEDFPIEGVCALSRSKSRCLAFIKRADTHLLQQANALYGCLVIAAKECAGLLSINHVLSSQPRLDFIKAAQHFFPPYEPWGIAETARISSLAKIGFPVAIGEYAVIGPDVELGSGCRIGHHAVIDHCTAGENCTIKSHAVIGEKGFGFEFDENKKPIAFPHYGRVILGNRVEIGATTVVCRGTLGDTTLNDDVKLDDNVFIAHNVCIGANSVVIANAEVSGSAHLGKNVWVAPMASILNGIKVGDRALVGLGAVVIRPVEPDQTVVGNPAHPIERRQ